MDKIKELKELNELLKSGAITLEEFNSLKTEILTKNTENTFESVKITLRENTKILNWRAFKNENGKTVYEPEISEIDLDKITTEEKKIIVTFLKEKYLNAPNQFTEDERILFNKLLTQREIDSIDSKRSGYNHGLPAILSCLCGLATLYIMYNIPCMIFFGGISGIMTTIVLSLSVLSKANATSYDRATSFIGLATAVTSGIMLWFWAD